MNSKENQRLTDLFGKLNSQENPGDEFSSVPEGEKLKFFWESCTPEKIDYSSIIKKTQQKMRRDAMRRRRNYLLVASASIAASVLICISTIHFWNQNENRNIDLQAIAERMDAQSVKEITLVTSKEQHNLAEDAFIKYSKEGKVAINSQDLKDEEPASVEQEYNQLLVPPGKRARIELSDGTLLIVNSQSKVIYPRRFTGDVRKIYAEGEVFLEVAHDNKHPFIVESDEFKLRVLGTKFNISTYKNAGSTNIVLVEGSVEVTDKQDKKATLTPNELLTISNGTIAFQKQVDVSEYISWVDGILLLKGNDLSHIIQKLSVYYGVSIQCSPSVAKEKVYGKLDLQDNLDNVLECLQQTLPMKIEKNNASYILK